MRIDKSNKSEKLRNFAAWVETLDERIIDWLNNLDTSTKIKMNFSIDSLDEVEKFLIKNFTLDSLNVQSNKYAIDGIASYVLKVFEKHWNPSQYTIELDDPKNILFNRPAIITQPQIGAAFSPYMFISGIINLKRIGILRKNLESRMK
ncbi:hypothetical protein [Portibacter lacus]|uniref:Uncharacterized protein n=1 Tax=Portibacter lacus TaxID=1099794 RepID=A0AA37WCJ9_9BACT|nr:hypothetical protein [Portibacter lacus]GLR16153.1 hypothetical protein GCM10007940_07680 [Portibacter lacus]